MRRGGLQLRFQKRITLMKGVRQNVGRRGVGVTIGGRLARFGITSRGQLYRSAAISGTEISMRRTMANAGQLAGEEGCRSAGAGGADSREVIYRDG